MKTLRPILLLACAGLCSCGVVQSVADTTKGVLGIPEPVRYGAASDTNIYDVAIKDAEVEYFTNRGRAGR